MTMTKKEFYQTVRDAVKGRLSSEKGIEVRLENVEANNGVAVGLCFFTEGNDISPFMYLDKLYELYCLEDMKGVEIVDCIVEFYNESKEKSSFIKNINKNIDAFLQSGEFKDYIIPCVCNEEQNKEKLKELPHTCENGLALYYQVQMTIGNNSAVFSLANIMVEAFHLDLKEIDECAWENVATQLPYTLTPLDVMVKDILYENELIQEDLDDIPDTPFWVLSNETRTGASIGLFDKEILSDVANELNENLLIIPSSVNELLICSADSIDKGYCLQMLRDTNRFCIEESDKLSDSIFLYDKDTRELSIYDGIEKEEPEEER